jgi:hypothetical protein
MSRQGRPLQGATQRPTPSGGQARYVDVTLFLLHQCRKIDLFQKLHL